MVAKWCGVVSSSRSQSEFPFLQKGWPAIADGVVSASRTRKMCDSKKHRRSSHNTTPSFCTSYRLCKNPPLLKKGNFAPVFLYFSHKKLCSDIPLLAEGVAAIADGVVSASRTRIASKRHCAVSPNTTPSFFAVAKKSTPSKKGEFTLSFFVFLSQKVVLGYSPSAEGEFRSKS